MGCALVSSDRRATFHKKGWLTITGRTGIAWSFITGTECEFPLGYTTIKRTSIDSWLSSKRASIKAYPRVERLVDTYVQYTCRTHLLAGPALGDRLPSPRPRCSGVRLAANAVKNHVCYSAAKKRVWKRHSCIPERSKLFSTSTRQSWQRVQE